MNCIAGSVMQVLFGQYYLLEKEEPATYIVEMLMMQGNCRACASPMIRASECRKTNTGCYIHRSGAGREQFTVALAVHSDAAMTATPILIASQRAI